MVLGLLIDMLHGDWNEDMKPHLYVIDGVEGAAGHPVSTGSIPHWGAAPSTRVSRYFCCYNLRNVHPGIVL